MRQSTRLIINTGATYCRMLLTVAIGLGVTRLLVRQLGNDDFGLLTLLGGAGGFLAVITGSLNVSAQRYLAFEVGRKDSERIRIVFNTATGLYLGVGLLIGAVGVTLAPFLNTLLKIPPGREDAAYWVFQLTVGGLVLAFIATPFRTMFLATQELVYSAVLDIFDTLAKLAAALCIFFLPGDRLIGYACLLLIASAVAQVAGIVICLIRYPESRPDPKRFKWAELGPMAGLAGWAMLNLIAYYLAMQSSDILLNLFFGAAMLTAINAAFALAMQISSYQNTLGLVINRVVGPAMIAAEGRGDRPSVRFLTLVACKWCVLLALFYLVPLQFETHYLLSIWIGRGHELPPYGEIFVRIVSVWMCIGMCGTGFNSAIISVGKMAGYTIWGSILLFGSMALSIIVLLLGAPPWGLPASIALCSIVILLFQVVYVGRMIDLSLSHWLRRVVAPTFVVLAAGLAVGGVLHVSMPEGLPRLLAIGIGGALAMMLTIWTFGVEPPERELLLRTVRNIRARVGI